MKHVIVVEDNPDSQFLVRVVLAKSYRLSLFTTGTEALDAMRRDVPDLVLLDISLPGMDGVDVARHVRSDPALQYVPLIAFTAFAMVGDRERLLAARFDDYLAKPFTVTQLLEIVERWIGR